MSRNVIMSRVVLSVAAIIMAALVWYGIQVALEYRDVISSYTAQGIARNRIPPTAITQPIFTGVFWVVIGLIVFAGAWEFSKKIRTSAR